MTTYTITIESKETFEWLKSTFESFEKKAMLDPSRWSGIVEHLSNIKLAIEETEIEKETPVRKKKEEYLPNLCPDHPTYTAERPPKVDCKGHWEAYKKMNPLAYAAARRKYDRSKNNSK